MKQIFKTKFFLLALLVIASSCSRSINGIPFGRVKHVKQIETISSVAQKQSDENLTASVDETTPVIAEKKYSIRFEAVETGINAVDCDTIIFKTGVRIVVMIIDIKNSEIKYKFCNDLNGETYSINQSKVLMVKYANAPQNNVTEISTQIKPDTTKNNTVVNAPQPTIIVDTLFLKSGQHRGVKVIEISQQEIKYKDSDFPDGPTYAVNKSNIERIKYANGKQDVFANENYQEEKKPASTNAGIGFTLALIGWCLPPLAIVGFIMSVVALNKINKNPENYSKKERGNAMGGIISFVIEAALVLFFILLRNL